MSTEINRKSIYNVFYKLNIGTIERIFENQLKANEKFKRIILKIKWNKTVMANQIQERLRKKLPVNIVYEMPWFWKVVLAR
jgi:hypothetical protein